MSSRACPAAQQQLDDSIKETIDSFLHLNKLLYTAWNAEVMQMIFNGVFSPAMIAGTSIGSHFSPLPAMPIDKCINMSLYGHELKNSRSLHTDGSLAGGRLYSFSSRYKHPSLAARRTDDV